MKIALLGYGKMGKTIERLALEKGHEIVYKLSERNEEGLLEDAEVAIEFSSPEVAVTHILKCFDTEIPVVCGTTGWLKDYEKVLKVCESRNGSFLYASNFSIGVNLFFNLNLYFSALMKPWREYIPSIEEIHHTQKKDAPSGTAISLAEGVLKHSNLKNWELDTQNPESLNIHAIREGDVKGTHTIFYNSPIDSLSIKHEAHSRDGFALGALLAAEWLLGKKGVYSMKDVLNLH
ncbi:MAG: 4-hydroxy-tetrahydrodipicolinate reductase [Flavobacteriaceae bacterium]